MGLSLNAIEYGHSTEFDVLVMGLRMESGEYILFQQGLTSEAGANEPPYFEYKDQLFGGYGIVKSCVLDRTQLIVNLSQSLNGVNKFVIDLGRVEIDIPVLGQQLEVIFKNHKEVLAVGNT